MLNYFNMSEVLYVSGRGYAGGRNPGKKKGSRLYI